MKKTITFFLLIAAFCAYTQNAALDPAFGNLGYSVHSNTSEINCFNFDQNGGILSAGTFNQGGGSWHLTITKTDANGLIDTSFGTNGKVTTVISESEYPHDIMIQPDGKIIVAGSVSFATSGNAGFVIRYNSDGSLDTSFATNGIFTLSTSNLFYSIILPTDGSIILGGNDISSKGILVKLDSNGIEDSSFGTNGILPLDAAGFEFVLGQAILLSDANILCVGHDDTDTSNQKIAYCKIDTQGNFDTSFGQNGNGKVVTDLYNTAPNTSESLRQAKELPDNTLILEGGLLGQFYNSNILVKINSDGSFDTTFGTSGVVNHSYPRIGLELQADGKIIIGGTKLINSNSSGYSITRFNSDGSLDTTFNNGNGFVDIDPTPDHEGLQYIKLQATDTLIIGGSSKLNSVGNFTLARILLDTPLSVEEPLEQFVKVYPNPFKERFFVEDYEEIIKEIKIFDNAGRIIKTVSEPTQTVREIHTHFASGMYFINIETKDGRTMNKKMIKK